MKLQHKTVNTQTTAGIKEAERLQAAGWRVILNGIYSIMFEREAPSEQKKN